MLIYGAGGHAKVIIDCLLSQNIPIGGVIDDDPLKTAWHGFPVVNGYREDIFPNEQLIISIGNNKTRKSLTSVIRHDYGITMHRSAIVAADTEVGKGTVVFHQAVIQSGAVIGYHAIVNTSATVDHDCQIGDFVHISPNAVLCGAVRVEEGTCIGAGAIVIPNIKIGKWCMIGAGAVIIRDVPDYAVVVGNPGKVIKYRKGP